MKRRARGDGDRATGGTSDGCLNGPAGDDANHGSAIGLRATNVTDGRTRFADRCSSGIGGSPITGCTDEGLLGGSNAADGGRHRGHGHPGIGNDTVDQRDLCSGTDDGDLHLPPILKGT